MMPWADYKNSDAVEQAKNRLKRELTHQGFQGWRDAVSLAGQIRRALADMAQTQLLSDDEVAVDAEDGKVRVRAPLALLPPPMRELKHGRWISVFMALDWLAGIVAWRDVQVAAQREQELERAGRLLDDGWALVHKRPGRRFRATFLAMNEQLPSLVWEFWQRIERGELALEDAQRGDYFIAPVIDFGWPSLPDTSISKEAVMRHEPTRYDGSPEDEAALRQAAADLADKQSTASLIRWVEANWNRTRGLVKHLRELDVQWRRVRERRQQDAFEHRLPPGTQRELFGLGIRLSL